MSRIISRSSEQRARDEAAAVEKAAETFRDSCIVVSFYMRILMETSAARPPRILPIFQHFLAWFGLVLDRQMGKTRSIGRIRGLWDSSTSRGFEHWSLSSGCARLPFQTFAASSPH